MTADLVRRVTPIRIPPQDRVRVELGSTDASNVVPDEFKADIVCEAAVLIVVCWDAAEADKCRAAIPLGHPGFVLIPVVIGPRDGADLDGANPWLTVLAGSMGAIDLDADTGRRAVLDAIRDTRSNTPVTRTLTAIILGVASDAARAELEAMMETKEYKNDFFDRIEARGKAEALVTVLASRNIELTPEQHEQVTSCLDLDQLGTWLSRAGTATTANDVFKD